MRVPLTDDPQWQATTVAANTAKIRSLRLQNFILWMKLIPAILIVAGVLIVGALVLFD